MAVKKIDFNKSLSMLVFGALLNAMKVATPIPSVSSQPMMEGSLKVTSLLDYDRLDAQSSMSDEMSTRDEDVLSSLIEFLIDGSTGRNIFIFYDYGELAISDSIATCYERGAEVTLFSCKEGVKYLANITMAFNPLESVRNMITICSPKNTKALFQEIHDKYLESAAIHWFVILQEDILDSIIPLMREGTEVTFSLRKELHFYELKRSFIDINNKVALLDLGWWSWDKATGIRKLLRHPLYRPTFEVYGDFGGRELIATVNDNWPFWILTYPEDGSVVPIAGVDYNVINTMGQKLNFTYRMELVPDGKWGGIMADGSITGMVGVVHRHEAHFAINEFTLTGPRGKAIDFTNPYFYESATLISPAPVKTLKSYAVFTSFTYEVWILVIALQLAIGPLVVLFVRTRKKLFGEVNEKWENVQDVTFMMFRSMVMQGSKVPSKGVFYRIVFSAWFLFTFVVITLYADVMISFLGVPSYEKPIDSVYDLLDAIDNDNFVLVLGCGGNDLYMYSNSTIKIYKEIYKRFDHKIGCIKSWDSAMDMVYSGKYVFSNNRYGAEVRANLRGRSNFHFAANEFYAHGYSIACPNGSPYKLVFDEILVRMLSHGLINKYVKDELDKAHGGKDKREKGPEPIGIIHLQGAFYLLVFGMVLGFCLVMVEMAVHNPK